jgi:hypothetical protein
VDGALTVRNNGKVTAVELLVLELSSPPQLARRAVMAIMAQFVRCCLMVKSPS